MDSDSIPSSADLAFRNPLIVRKILEHVATQKKIISAYEPKEEDGSEEGMRFSYRSEEDLCMRPSDVLKWLDLRLLTRVFKRECGFLLDRKFSRKLNFTFDEGHEYGGHPDALVNDFNLPIIKIPLFFKLMKRVKFERVRFIYDEYGRTDRAENPKPQTESHRAILKEIVAFPTPIRTILNVSSTCPSVKEGIGACGDCVTAARNATELYGPVQLNAVKDLEKPIHWKHLIFNARFFKDSMERFYVSDLPLAENLKIFENALKHNTCDVFELLPSEVECDKEIVAHPEEILKSLIKMWSVKKLIIKFHRDYEFLGEQIDCGGFSKYRFDRPEASPNFRICDENSQLDVVVWQANKGFYMWKSRDMGEMMIAAFNSFPCSTFVFLRPRSHVCIEELIKFATHALSKETTGKRLDVLLVLRTCRNDPTEAVRCANELTDELATKNFTTQFDCGRAIELVARLAADLPLQRTALLSTWKENSPDVPMFHVCFVNSIINSYTCDRFTNDYSFENGYWTSDEEEYGEDDEENDSPDSLGGGDEFLLHEHSDLDNSDLDDDGEDMDF